jgi:hypothetical protein
MMAQKAYRGGVPDNSGLQIENHYRILAIKPYMHLFFNIQDAGRFHNS